MPGKVLGTGAMAHSVNIAAIDFSACAKSLKDAKCKIVGIKDMLGMSKAAHNSVIA